MDKLLLQTFSLERPFDGKYVIDCECKIIEFEKLSQILAEDLKNLDSLTNKEAWLNEKIYIKLNFATIKHDKSILKVTGLLKTKFYLTCQTCLKLVEKGIEVPVKLALHEQCDDSHNIHGYEYWELAGSSIKTLDLIEELLIMAIPLYVKHNINEKCVSHDANGFHKPQVTLPFVNLKNKIKEGNN